LAPNLHHPFKPGFPGNSIKAGVQVCDGLARR
jgi:hypothetical protein